MNNRIAKSNEPANSGKTRQSLHVRTQIRAAFDPQYCKEQLAEKEDWCYETFKKSFDMPRFYEACLKQADYEYRACLRG